jgi:hypothetical protein
MNTKNNYSKVFFSFLSGFLAMVGIILFWDLFELPDIPYSYFFYNAFLEEVFKYITALILLLRFKFRSSQITFIGAGFGFAEGLSHFLFPDGTASLYPLWMHIISALIMGYFFWKAQQRTGIQKVLNYALALLGPVIYHGIYNEYIVQLLGRDWSYILFG